MTNFLETVAHMGMCDFLYKDQKTKWIHSWMNEKEKKAYNIGWNYARHQCEVPGGEKVTNTS